MIEMDNMMSTELTRRALNSLPLSLNTAYGDAFQANQLDDTLSKVADVAESGFGGVTMIGTKHPVGSWYLQKLASLKPDLWVFLAITNLGESRKYALDDYFLFYHELCQIFTNVVCAVRPIIPGRNDSIEHILPIIDVAASGARLLTYTGYRDPSVPGSPKAQFYELAQVIRSESENRGVFAAEKCACVLAHVSGSPCRVHSDGWPQSLEALGCLGYEWKVEGDSICLVGFEGSDFVSKGDLSFARLLTGSGRMEAKLSSPSEIMQMRGPNGEPLVATSSFFDWARQKACHLSCDYCFANTKKGYGILLDSFGVNPLSLAPRE